MVGSALVREAQLRGGYEILTAGREELDLLNQAECRAWLEDQKPDQIIIAAAKVGGIHANATYPAEFIYENLAIATHLIEGSRQAGVERVLFLGSSCIYPKMAPQPMPEDCLLTSPLEVSNEAYAVAKIAGLKMCQHYRAQYGLKYHSAMPTNLYGPGDNFHASNSHVIPALLRRFHEAVVTGRRSVTNWGTGEALREFLHVDDLADACLFCMAHYEGSIALNVGVGNDLTIRELVETVCDVVGFEGELVFDASKPDGAPRKWLSVDRLAELGWRAKTGLRDGIGDTYRWFLEQGSATVAE